MGLWLSVQAIGGCGQVLVGSHPSGRCRSSGLTSSPPARSSRAAFKQATQSTTAIGLSNRLSLFRAQQGVVPEFATQLVQQPEVPCGVVLAKYGWIPGHDRGARLPERDSSLWPGESLTFRVACDRLLRLTGSRSEFGQIEGIPWIGRPGRPRFSSFFPYQT
jgi:hypothetical protein